MSFNKRFTASLDIVTGGASDESLVILVFIVGIDIDDIVGVLDIKNFK
jgi:hypothetical protein